MGENPGGLILSVMGPFFFYGGLIIIVLMVKKLSRDIADLKKVISDLQETVMMESRPPVHGSVERE